VARLSPRLTGTGPLAALGRTRATTVFQIPMSLADLEHSGRPAYIWGHIW
jgi:hypothetical protein